MNSPLINWQPAEPAEKRTLASQLEARIRQDIINGTLAPGIRLRLKELADTYAVGVIPLREALSRLASSGFVSAADQKGFSVGQISAPEIADITAVRLHVECKALADSIRQGDVEWESRVLAAHHRLDRLAIVEGPERLLKPEWETAHEGFHQALISSCNSPTLLRLCASLRDQTARYRFLSMHYADSGERDVPNEHRQLLDAALAKDIDKACELLATHYQTTTDSVLKHALLG
ncbi:MULTISPECIES: GntR family transcriptional regulator [unclassified Pseudomonas]|uniref:GntR family transcriptional regulator n=1 Tax=unclassified Pseudomonas TaxID=196821 RepID=UPI0015A0D237|nr:MULTISPECIES: FCD domain-containing protein [unclassified Pseudomonas]NWC93045.1 FCD domain-containing protein [Pseudomonas sp. IPO3779]NWD19463.1 FCD domain-containing protein [Pseudomonas sp. IPO3778]